MGTPKCNAIDGGFFFSSLLHSRITPLSFNICGYFQALISLYCNCFVLRLNFAEGFLVHGTERLRASPHAPVWLGRCISLPGWGRDAFHAVSVRSQCEFPHRSRNFRMVPPPLSETGEHETDHLSPLRPQSPVGSEKCIGCRPPHSAPDGRQAVTACNGLWNISPAPETRKTASNGRPVSRKRPGFRSREPTSAGTED